MSSSMEVDEVSEVSKYLSDMENNSKTPSELRPLWARIRTLHDRKLWYQLTNAVEEAFAHPAAQSDPEHNQVLPYQQFVSTFAGKINQNARVRIALQVSRQYADANKALAFLLEVAEEVDTPSSQEAFVTARMEAAHFQLLLGDLTATKEAMDKCQKILDGFDSVEPATHAAYYRVCGDFYKAKAEYASYYRNALLFLACINVERDLSPADQAQRAHDLGVSALLGESIYNFGELLLHPILKSLSATPYAYLSDILFSFNSGDIGRFESLSPHLSGNNPGAIPILAENAPFLSQKIRLMALIESVFQRGSTDRVIPFESIAAETKVPVNEVEHLVMKALSLKLIKGTLDQYAQLAKITWVQPRVLDERQIKALQARLEKWCERVQGVAEFVKTQTREYNLCFASEA